LARINLFSGESENIARMGSTNSLRNKNIIEKQERFVKQVEEWSISMLEEFVYLAYENCSSVGILRAILDNAVSRSALVSYVTSNEEFYKYLRFEKSALDNILKFGINRRCSIRAFEYENFLCPVSVSYYGDLLQREIVDHETRGGSGGILTLASTEALVMVCLLMLPKFLLSDDFKNFRTIERNRAIEMVKLPENLITTIPDILIAKDFPLGHTCYVQAEANLILPYSNFGISESEGTAVVLAQGQLACATLVAENTKTCDDLQNIVNAIDYLEIQSVFQSGSWLFAFIAAVENLPLSVTISTARRDRYGFPLIYVNKQFEVMTGYERSIVIGANCRFLQRRVHGYSSMESDNIHALSTALRCAEPVKVVITNYRKNGTPFKNLLLLRPIFDKTGVYKYVVGLQFDLTYYDTGAHTLRLADRLFSLLPHILAN